MTKAEKRKALAAIACGDQLSGLTPAQLSWLTPAQLSWLTRDQLSWLTPAQLSWLTRAQLSWLTRDQLSWLTRAQLSGLTRAQLSGLTRAQLSGLTRAQLSWLTRDQLSWLTPAQLSWLTPAQLSGLTRDQLSWLTRAQLSWLTSEAADYVIAKRDGELKDIPRVDKPYTKILEGIKSGDRKHDQSTFGPDCDPATNLCFTPMCTAGHLVNLAGSEGYKLKEKYGWVLAATLIHRKSRPDVPPQNFGNIPNEWALAYIEERAEEEKAMK